MSAASGSDAAEAAGADATNIPDDHPRAASLRTRERMKAAVTAGLVHGTGLIAHGRGEAFDYLLGEQTPPESRAAIAEGAALLRQARQPVLSLNGNVVALAARACVEVAHALPSLRLEVNLFHRTEERVRRLVAAMEEAGARPGEVLGPDPDHRIPGLSSDRARCHRAGIGEADVVLVPLEDGDRCQALKAMGKTVVTVDLNPLSRTARAADVTIVDELTRVLPLLAQALREGSPRPPGFDNGQNLQAVRRRMAQNLLQDLQ
ncbi:MAG TPA: phosphopantothenate/pantothenate synthetase [Candidatus Thermoplasmatota archaeon]|nr:phosphopantothenate/pantothenate synthetase [Candidatus Thermoplasmatota archaeon]